MTQWIFLAPQDLSEHFSSVGFKAIYENTMQSVLWELGRILDLLHAKIVIVENQEMLRTVSSLWW